MAGTGSRDRYSGGGATGGGARARIDVGEGVYVVYGRGGPGVDVGGGDGVDVGEWDECPGGPEGGQGGTPFAE